MSLIDRVTTYDPDAVPNGSAWYNEFIAKWEWNCFECGNEGTARTIKTAAAVLIDHIWNNH